MTTEQKAKAYDEALEKARKINSGEGIPAPPDWTICEVLFPELKESEDEKIRKEIIKIIRFFYGSSLSCKPLVSEDDMLAWLEKQGQVKESEIPQQENKTCEENSNSLTNKAWSEEDERILLRLIAHFDWHGDTRFTKEDCQEATNWLKSLRPQPHWKPSDEQMTAFEYYLENIIDDKGVFGHQLVKLYQDLKKLKEG